MTKEEIAAAAKAEAEKKAEDEAAAEPIDNETDGEEGDEGEGDAGSVDYEAELAKEKAAREKAEKALAEDRFKAAEARRKKQEEAGGKDEEEASDEDDDKPVTRKELARIQADADARAEKRSNEQAALSIAKSLSSSDKEAELTLEIWKNHKMPGDTLEDQIAFAHAGINRKRIAARETEARRALLSKETRSKNGASTMRDAAPSGEAKIKPQDAAALKAAGMVWNGQKRFYEKKLGSGKVLIFDPKTGQRRTVRAS